MTIHEFGDKYNPIIMLLPGTTCYNELSKRKEDDYEYRRYVRNQRLSVM